MAKRPSNKLNQSLAADASASPSASTLAPQIPAQNPQPDELTEATAPGFHAAAPSAKPAPEQEPSHLLTPLAALWPTATPPEPTKPQEKAPPPEKGPVPAAGQKVKVTFVLLDLGAKQVSLSGDFNGWSPKGTPMQRQTDGHWEVAVALAPGRYQYKFVADGQWIPDPQAREQVWNPHGTLNSLIEVRA